MTERARAAAGDRKATGIVSPSVVLVESSVKAPTLPRSCGYVTVK
jgi:hypothetical protein